MTNTGNQGATDVVITYILPEHTSLVAASDGGVEAGGEITWHVASLVDRSATFRVSDGAGGVSQGVILTIVVGEAGDDRSVAAKPATEMAPESTSEETRLYLPGVFSGFPERVAKPEEPLDLEASIYLPLIGGP